MPLLLSVNNYYYHRGGADSVFLEHNRIFEQHGWRVVPFSMKHPKNLETRWSKHFIDEIEFGAEYSLAQKLARVPKVIYSFEARRKLSRLLDETRPDICHVHNLYHHISPSILSLLAARGVPTVMTLHDLKIACPAYSMLTHDGICERCRGGRIYNVVKHRCIKGSVALSTIVMLEAAVHGLLQTYARYVTRFVVPSRFYVDKLVEWGWPRTRFAYVPNFVDTRAFQPAYTPGNTFVYIGRLSVEKGLITLIRAAAQAGCRVAIAGTGPQEEELRQLTARMQVDVSFLGYLRGDALREVIAGARALVLPSEWYENAPLSVLEAYAMGKPVIGAESGGIPELIRSRETGIIFPRGDVAALAAAMRAIADAPDAEVEEMGRRARAWVEQDFTVERYRDRMLSLYAELGVPAASRLEASVSPA